ncbi:MAG: hypothetical protein KDD55_00735 [Bdellovibrionales bacterium]|nr:hypothetical protein [Bdellovibrionales bacterium]
MNTKSLSPVVALLLGFLCFQMPLFAESMCQDSLGPDDQIDGIGSCWILPPYPSLQTDPDADPNSWTCPWLCGVDAPPSLHEEQDCDPDQHEPIGGPYEITCVTHLYPNPRHWTLQGTCKVLPPLYLVRECYVGGDDFCLHTPFTTQELIDPERRRCRQWPTQIQ